MDSLNPGNYSTYPTYPSRPNLPIIVLTHPPARSSTEYLPSYPTTSAESIPIPPISAPSCCRKQAGPDRSYQLRPGPRHAPPNRPEGTHPCRRVVAAPPRPSAPPTTPPAHPGNSHDPLPPLTGTSLGSRGPPWSARSTPETADEPEPWSPNVTARSATTAAVPCRKTPRTPTTGRLSTTSSPAPSVAGTSCAISSWPAAPATATRATRTWPNGWPPATTPPTHWPPEHPSTPPSQPTSAPNGFVPPPSGADVPTRYTGPRWVNPGPSRR